MRNLNGKKLRDLLMAVTLGLSMVVVSGCGDEGVGEGEGVGVGGGVGAGEGVGTAGTAEVLVDIEDITENPAAFAGRVVTISGEVEEIYSPRGAFSVTGSGVIAENQVLVLTRGDAPMIEEDQNVRVTGRVQAYAVADLERFESELGWDFSPGLEAELERVKTVLVAERVLPVRQ